MRCCGRCYGRLVGVMVMLLAAGSTAFYVPGVAPVEFTAGAQVKVQAIKMTSSHTQLPYDYYSLPMCRPDDGVLHYKSENLGEVLRGDRIVNTPYKLAMKQDVQCRLLCHSPGQPMKWTSAETASVVQRVEQDYLVHLLVDNLPCATRLPNLLSGQIQLDRGYRLGYVTGDGKVQLNNHLDIIIYYHTEDEIHHRVVRFEVETRSVALNGVTGSSDSCKIDTDHQPMLLDKNKPTDLLFTYSVRWLPSQVRWASRWDPYLAMSDVQIHWFSIINSVVVMLFLSGILTMIIIRTLRRDIAKYNQEDSLEDALEETGWKLVHGDVFRPPRRSRLLTTLLGTGLQLYFMAFIIILFAMLGMLSPASRGSYMTAAITMYNFMGIVAGFYSARLYKTLRGRHWKSAALWTAVLYPGCVSAVVLFLNFFIVSQGSSRSIPFTSMLSVLAMWFGISVPLVFIGSYFGYKREPHQHPVRTNQIPRQVPDQPWYLHPVFCSLLAGVLPFGAMFIELLFIFSAIWENQFYYMFGFLFLVFIILTISCSQISIVLVYFQLCGEDYHWWWRSFIVSGGSAIYMAIYCVYYFVTKLDIEGFVPTLLYFGYSTLMVATFFLITGTVGFIAAYSFIKRIYAAVKID